MPEQQQDQHMIDSDITKAQYSTIIHNEFPMLASLMRHHVTDYCHHLVYISLRLHLVFCTHFGDAKVDSFIVFNISKLLLFCISLSCVDGTLCFTFWIQTFIFATTRLPQLTQSSLLRYILTKLSISPSRLLSACAFFLSTHKSSL